MIFLLFTASGLTFVLTGEIVIGLLYIVTGLLVHISNKLDRLQDK